MGLFFSKKRKEQEALLMATEEYVFRIEDITYLKNNLVSLGGRMLKGTICVGDKFIFNGVAYEIAALMRGIEPNTEIAQNLYCGLVIHYKTTGIYKTIFKLGAVKIVKPNCLEKDNQAYEDCTLPTQSKTYICARCKKEITDDESKWIENHRFCANCAAPPKKATMESHLEAEAKEAGYQAYMDYARGSLTPEQAYSNRGFVKDKDGKWVYGKLMTKNTFICSKCGKELAKKYMHTNHICVDCATLPANNTPQKQKGQSVYNKNKSLCLCYYKKNEYEWYQVELQFNANNEILIVDTYYWPAHRGASNGGQSTTKLDADYFTKNTIDDFIVFLKNNYKLAKDFNQDFSALKNRDDIKALFENSNKTVQPRIKFADEQPLGLYRDKKYLHKLFDVYFNAEEQQEKFVCYDTITGIPYLIDSQTKYEGHAIISSWYGTKLTYEQVALFAQNYAPTSPLSDIRSDNWKEFFDIDNTTQHNPSTYTDSITRESNTAFLSNSGYLGSIVPIKLDWRDIEGAPRFNFAGAPHFDEISVGLIKQGKYINQLFITIINDGYPSGSGCGTVELFPEKYNSYEGVKRYIEGRGFSVYQPIAEETYNKNINELIV